MIRKPEEQDFVQSDRVANAQVKLQSLDRLLQEPRLALRALVGAWLVTMVVPFTAIPVVYWLLTAMLGASEWLASTVAIGLFGLGAVYFAKFSPLARLLQERYDARLGLDEAVTLRQELEAQWREAAADRQ